MLATSDALDVESFCDDIAAATKPYEPSFAALIREIPARLREDRETALNAIAWAGSAGPEFERPIITPLVVPTVLASLWAVFRHPWSWPHAVAEAIGLGGDVDTLGAIVGAVAGVRLGLSAIPAPLAAGVVGAARIKKLANR